MLIGAYVAIAVVIVIGIIIEAIQIHNARSAGDATQSDDESDVSWDAKYEWANPAATANDKDLAAVEKDWAKENEWHIKPDSKAIDKPEPVITYNPGRPANKEEAERRRERDDGTGPRFYGSVPPEIAYRTHNGVAPRVTRAELREKVHNPDIRVALRSGKKVSDRFASGRVGERGEEKTRRIVDEWAKKHHAVVHHGYFINKQMKDSDVDHIIAFESHGIQQILLLDSKNYAAGVYEEGRRKLKRTGEWEQFHQSGSMELAVQQLQVTLMGMPFVSKVHGYTVVWCSSKKGHVELRGFEKAATKSINGENLLTEVLDQYSDASEPNLGTCRALDWAFSPRGKVKKTWSLGMERAAADTERREYAKTHHDADATSAADAADAKPGTVSASDATQQPSAATQQTSAAKGGQATPADTAMPAGAAASDSASGAAAMTKIKVKETKGAAKGDTGAASDSDAAHSSEKIPSPLTVARSSKRAREAAQSRVRRGLSSAAPQKVGKPDASRGSRHDTVENRHDANDGDSWGASRGRAAGKKPSKRNRRRLSLPETELDEGTSNADAVQLVFGDSERSHEEHRPLTGDEKQRIEEQNDATMKRTLAAVEKVQNDLDTPEDSLGFATVLTLASNGASKDKSRARQRAAFRKGRGESVGATADSTPVGIPGATPAGPGNDSHAGASPMTNAELAARHASVEPSAGATSADTSAATPVVPAAPAELKMPAPKMPAPAANSDTVIRMQDPDGVASQTADENDDAMLIDYAEANSPLRRFSDDGKESVAEAGALAANDRGPTWTLPDALRSSVSHIRRLSASSGRRREERSKKHSPRRVMGWVEPDEVKFEKELPQLAGVFADYFEASAVFVPESVAAQSNGAESNGAEASASIVYSVVPSVTSATQHDDAWPNGGEVADALDASDILDAETAHGDAPSASQIVVPEAGSSASTVESAGVATVESAEGHPGAGQTDVHGTGAGMPDAPGAETGDTGTAAQRELGSGADGAR